MEIPSSKKSLQKKNERTLKDSAYIAQPRNLKLIYERTHHHHTNVARAHPENRGVRLESMQTVAACPMTL